MKAPPSREDRLRARVNVLGREAPTLAASGDVSESELHLGSSLWLPQSLSLSHIQSLSISLPLSTPQPARKTSDGLSVFHWAQVWAHRDDPPKNRLGLVVFSVIQPLDLV